MGNEHGLPEFSPSELQFLLSLCALGFHSIVLYHLSSPLVISSMTDKSAVVFLKKEGSNLVPLFASELQAHGIRLTKSLRTAIDKNWKNNIMRKDQPLGSHNDSMSPPSVRKISDGCFEVCSTADMANFVHVHCDECKPMVDINHMLGKFRDSMEADVENIIWFFKTFSVFIYAGFSRLCTKQSITPYLPSYITKAFEVFNLVELCTMAILFYVIISCEGIRAMFVRCFKLPMLLENSLVVIGECARTGFNSLLFFGMMEVYFIALASNGELLSFADPFTIVNLVMAYILLDVVMSKRSSRFGLILAGGVVLSTVLLICWKMLCTVPPAYWLGVANN